MDRSWRCRRRSVCPAELQGAGVGGDARGLPVHSWPASDEEERERLQVGVLELSAQLVGC